jgi:hypothetical protein
MPDAGARFLRAPAWRGSVGPLNEVLSEGGQPLTLEANDTSVWVRRDGTWRCAMHTESISGDPYGRDRTIQGS